MLFEPDRHEALCAADWDASRAREAIRTIVDDIDCNRFVEGHWPVHPLDEEGDTPRTGFKGIYLGTAGNGYAFLKLYQRTGDSLWLERARSFAMHAIAQRDRMRQQFGQGRYTLWTGDPGLAVYLWHCLDGKASMPALDILQ